MLFGPLAAWPLSKIKSLSPVAIALIVGVFFFGLAGIGFGRGGIEQRVATIWTGAGGINGAATAVFAFWAAQRWRAEKMEWRRAAVVGAFALALLYWWYWQPKIGDVSEPVNAPVTIGEMLADGRITLERALSQEVEAANAQLPQRLDELTTITSMDSAVRQLNYNYTLSDIPIDEQTNLPVPKNIMEARMKAKTIVTVCQDEYMRSYIQIYDVKLGYRYFSTEGAPLGDFSIDETDCVASGY